MTQRQYESLLHPLLLLRTLGWWGDEEDPSPLVPSPSGGLTIPLGRQPFWSRAVGEKEVTRYNAVSHDERYRTHTTLSRIRGSTTLDLLTSPHKHNTLRDPLDTTLGFSKALSLDTCCGGQAGLQSSGLLLGRLLVC